MEKFGVIGHWIAENESLLSGLVALLVLTGLVLSPIGKGFRHLSARYGQSRRAIDQTESLPATSSTVAAEPLLAVLAFDNLSNDTELQFFSDGVSEEIIQRLSRGSQLKVIGRTSSFTFRGERKADAAHTLNCSHVLDGSIRRAGERVRISAHLVEASSQTTLWSDRYDRSLEDIFLVQDEVSDPRFVRLCARLGLVEYWMATGKWPDWADEVGYDFKAECEKVQHTPKEDFGF